MWYKLTGGSDSAVTKRAGSVASTPQLWLILRTKASTSDINPALLNPHFRMSRLTPQGAPQGVPHAAHRALSPTGSVAGAAPLVSARPKHSGGEDAGICLGPRC